MDIIMSIYNSESIKFEKLSICLDMHGCPNKCRHCWLGVTPNGNLSATDLKFVAGEFRPFTNNLEVFDRYREEDYPDNYKELWELTAALSDTKTPHFENISYWRAVRDKDYVPWLYSLGVRAAQLTIFGDEKTTDCFVGRKGAYSEILQTIEVLLQNKIAPRIQTFIYKNNIAQLPFIQQLIENLSLEKRCAGLEKEFAFFLHQGSCSGENAQFYDDWITPEDVGKIPQRLINFTLKHYGKASITEVLGKPEKELYKQLIHDSSTNNIVTSTPVFFIDKDFKAYPNYETPSPIWFLGNLKTDGAEKIINTYVNNRSPAQQTMLTVPIGEMVKKCANPESMRLFENGDYQNFILDKYCRESPKKIYNGG
jgi:MoaA/NifB/PqqE/SkfB family radical SAM enzyme